MDLYVLVFCMRDGEIEEAFGCSVDRFLQEVGDYVASRRTYGGAKIYAAWETAGFSRRDFAEACLAGQREDALRATILAEPAQDVAIERVVLEASGNLRVDAKYGDDDMQIRFTAGGWDFVAGLLADGQSEGEEDFALRWAEAIAEVQAVLQAWLKENTPEAKKDSSAALWYP